MKGAGNQLDGQQLFERQTQLEGEPSAPMIIADGLRTPENMGYVLRLAEAAGSKQVYFVSGDEAGASEHTAKEYQKKIRKAARHTEQRVTWDVCTRQDVLARRVLKQEVWIALEITDASRDIFATSLPENAVLVIGDERHGISLELLDACQQAVHIPMFGCNGSMNVTHALAIALFEWRRQMNDGSVKKPIVSERG